MVKNLPAMQETWVRSLSQEDPLDKEMATHSSILAWRIPWTEEPGRLQSMGWQRVGHDWATNTHTHTHKYYCITDAVDMNLGKLRVILRDRDAWYAAVHGLTKSWTRLRYLTITIVGLSWWLSSKEFTCNSGNSGWICGSGRSPGGGNSSSHQYSCLRNPMDRGAWQATVHGVAKEWHMT